MTVDELVPIALRAAKVRARGLLAIEPSFSRLDSLMHQMRDTAGGAKWAAIGYRRLLEAQAYPEPAQIEPIVDSLMLGFLTAAIEYAIEVSKRPRVDSTAEDRDGWIAGPS